MSDNSNFQRIVLTRETMKDIRAIAVVDLNILKIARHVVQESFLVDSGLELDNIAVLLLGTIDRDDREVSRGGHCLIFWGC